MTDKTTAQKSGIIKRKTQQKWQTAMLYTRWTTYV